MTNGDRFREMTNRELAENFNRMMEYASKMAKLGMSFVCSEESVLRTMKYLDETDPEFNSSDVVYTFELDVSDDEQRKAYANIIQQDE